MTLKASILVQESNTQIPFSFILDAARQIQDERPWSPLNPERIAQAMYDATADGCVDVMIYDEHGNLAGMAIIGLLFDIHVGDMAIIAAEFVYPEYRNSGVSRLIIRTLKDVARSQGLRWCGYSHMVRPCVQEFRFIDLEKP